MTAAVFIDSDLVDIRRFCGYPVFGTGTIVFPFPWWFEYYQALEVRLQNMTTTEASVVQTYLTNLRTLEAAIPNMSGNLDTAEASVWKRNPKELKDRLRLFDEWRRRFCFFLGVPVGPEMQGGRGGAGNSISLTV